MSKTVVIIGGGVAGLSAAHELVERGFDVTVYERRERLGGKAASTTSAHGFPAEHGFRFFPGWYCHLPDTLRRIPYKDRTVFDNLVAADQNLFARNHLEPVPALLRFPKSLAEIATVAEFPQRLLQAGLTPDDITFFTTRLLQFAAAPEPVRVRDYESRSWWEFMNADGRSPEFRAYLVDGLTRNTVAADPREASAYTIATVVLRTLADTLRPGSMVDRVLNGPTNEVWIDPWVEYLEAQGVEIQCDAELDSIEFDHKRIGSLRLLVGAAARRRATARIAALKAIAAARRRAAAPVPAGPALQLEELLSELEHRALGSQAESPETALKQGGFDLSELSDAEIDRALRAAHQRYEKTLQEDFKSVTADYYVLALPIEQMAYFVNRSPSLRREDPDLVNLLELSNNVEWMAGIQFYLTEDVKLTPGHIDCLDSEWALTAISQAQFWPDVDMKERGKGKYRGRVKTVLSVDISAWNRKGRDIPKEAYDCTPAEVAQEVWSQLKRSLHPANRPALLKDEHLLGFRPGQSGLPEESYNLDQELVDRFDRKKQGFYKRFESVRFSSEAVTARAADAKSGPPTPFVYGDRDYINAEPLFVNRAGTLALRPGAKTRIKNLFLAADYVRTTTDLATMEAANEAARLAVNEIITASGVKQPPCRTWTLSPSVDALRALARLFGAESAVNGGVGLASQVAATAATAAGNATRALAETFGQLISRRK